VLRVSSSLVVACGRARTCTTGARESARTTAAVGDRRGRCGGLGGAPGERAASTDRPGLGLTAGRQQPTRNKLSHPRVGGRCVHRAAHGMLDAGAAVCVLLLFNSSYASLRQFRLLCDSTTTDLNLSHIIIPPRILVSVSRSLRDRRSVRHREIAQRTRSAHCHSTAHRHLRSRASRAGTWTQPQAQRTADSGPATHTRHLLRHRERDAATSHRPRSQVPGGVEGRRRSRRHATHDSIYPAP
jgi:hypothetical protein